MNLSRIKIGLYEQAERIVGKQAIDRMYLDRCIKIYRKQQVIFIHIPKAAGTSVARAVLGKRAGHFTAETVRDRMGNDPYYKLYSFAVTRHPVDRLYSAYRYVKGNGGTEGGVRRHPDYDGPLFHTFEKFVMEWLPLQNILNGPVIFRPQYSFLFDSGIDLLVNDVLKLEEPEKLEQILTERLGRKIILERRNMSVTDLDNGISSLMRRRISEIYHRDHELLGY